jgi:hypothetical protein
MPRKIKNISDISEKIPKTSDISSFMAAPKSVKNSGNKKSNNLAKNDLSQKKRLDEMIQVAKFSKKNILAIILVVFLVSAIGSAGYFYYQYKQATSGNAAKDEAAGYVAKIGKFMVLPDEDPTVATVADVEKLSGQPFFAKAQNGDKVLFYTKAQKAILYRPSENKIIEATSMAGSGVSAAPQSSQTSATPVQNGTQALAQNEAQAEPVAPADSTSSTQTEEPKAETQAPEAQKLVKVAVYNGTVKKGIAKAIADKLTATLEVEIATTGNAKSNYAKTIVIDLGGSSGEIAKTIADSLSGEVGTLPEGETKPEADILVIGGSDFGG